MRSVLMASALLASLTLAPQAQAAGCVSGAVVGGVAGHMVGHGKLGAVAGCVVGHHKAKKQEEARKREDQPQEQR